MVQAFGDPKALRPCLRYQRNRLVSGKPAGPNQCNKDSQKSHDGDAQPGCHRASFSLVDQQGERFPDGKRKGLALARVEHAAKFVVPAFSGAIGQS